MVWARILRRDLVIVQELCFFVVHRRNHQNRKWRLHPRNRFRPIVDTPSEPHPANYNFDIQVTCGLSEKYQDDYPIHTHHTLNWDWSRDPAARSVQVRRTDGTHRLRSNFPSNVDILLSLKKSRPQIEASQALTFWMLDLIPCQANRLVHHFHYVGSGPSLIAKQVFPTAGLGLLVPVVGLAYRVF